MGRLSALKIQQCDQLKCWPKEVSLQDLPSLQRLEILNCQKLESLGDGEGGLPTTLKSLEIDGCSNLKSMPTRLENLTSLVKLSIVTQLPFFSQELALPTTIEVLKIFSCDNLMSLPKGCLSSLVKNLTSLKTLMIRECPQLHSLFLDDEYNDDWLPTTLNTLEICTRPNLKSLPMGMRSLTTLTELVIHECPQLHFLDVENNEHGLPNTLNTLDISTFPNLKSLPKGMQILTCLKELTINEFPQLYSLFPDDANNDYGLPTKIDTLNISTFFFKPGKIKTPGQIGIVIYKKLGPYKRRGNLLAINTGSRSPRKRVRRRGSL
ncbi:disease resistance protein RPS6-like [Tasmannia lanceolata]|uniref:disease resistance protein RPS6-like n=1 Tax=Tasmannia lanceolata TaxID=3420 RepID=UPI00406499B5